jgi:hypothetical protein
MLGLDIRDFVDVGRLMKIRHIKRRAKRPEFRRIGSASIFEFYAAAAVTRFFGPTKDDYERAAQFFGVRANL